MIAIATTSQSSQWQQDSTNGKCGLLHKLGVDNPTDKAILCFLSFH
jgi:hypothetical protein